MMRAKFLPAVVFATALVLSGVARPGVAGAAVPPAVEAAHGMVVTSQRLATEAGLAMLRQGGNAIDAAVAVGYAEAVVNPCCGNIGGGGFMVLRMRDGRSRFINFRETAPAAATADMYLDAAGNVIPRASLDGWKAAGVPGTVLGLDTALREYGTLPRQVVMAPAIRLAREGFVLTRADADILDAKAGRFRADPVAARIFLRADGTPAAAGRPAGANRSCRHAGGDRRERPRRLLQGPRRGGGGERVAGRRRDPHRGRSRELPDHGIAAADLHLSRLHFPVVAAAIFRRHHAVRDPEHRRGLRHARAGLSLGAGDPL